jgi:hypothetical protein
MRSNQSYFDVWGNGQAARFSLKGGLTSAWGTLKYPQFKASRRSLDKAGRQASFMTSIPPSQPPEKSSSMSQCKHPRVQIVSREEDAEFVECMECGDIFESSELKDMSIEETKLENEL